jgi:hypothetical protein
VYNWQRDLPQPYRLPLSPYVPSRQTSDNPCNCLHVVASDGSPVATSTVGAGVQLATSHNDTHTNTDVHTLSVVTRTPKHIRSVACTLTAPHKPILVDKQSDYQ